jgi:pimeloyl-ACP methyl ester carboxylesterase
MQLDWRAHLRWVQVQGRPVNVLDTGADRARPAVVFLHGLSGCWQNWLEQLPDFARDHRVIAIDLPGFGASPLPARAISVSGYAQMLAELLDALDVPRATIVGNSMGGFVGCEMAIRFPARVERLVLVASAGLSLRHMRHERRRGPRARIENLLFFGLGRLAQRTNLVVRSRRLRRALLLLIVAHPERLSGALVAEQAHGAGKPGFDGALDAMTTYPIRDRLGEIGSPTLIIWGQEDRLVPVRDASEFEWLIRDARKVVYPDAGHMVMLEQPARFNADVRAFIDR